MDRRELIKMITLATGGALIGGEFFLSGCTTGGSTPAGFTPQTIALLDEVAETIIPATSTPGAKAAALGEFMKQFVTDCYTPAEQQAFFDGIMQLDEESQKLHGKTFMEASPEQRHALLVSLEPVAKKYNQEADAKESAAYQEARKQFKGFQHSPRHYYTMMKQMTLLGFFTSKTGATETLRYVAVPQKYDGAFPYKKGDRAWAE